MSLDLEYASALRREIVAYLHAHADDTSDFAAAAIVVGELVANAARHAPGPACIEVDWRDDRAVLVIHDSGPGFEIGSVLPPDGAESGRGLYIVTSLAEHIEAERARHGGMRIRATLPVRRRRRQAPPLTECPMQWPFVRDSACRWPKLAAGRGAARG